MSTLDIVVGWLIRCLATRNPIRPSQYSWWRPHSFAGRCHSCHPEPAEGSAAPRAAIACRSPDQASGEDHAISAVGTAVMFGQALQILRLAQDDRRRPSVLQTRVAHGGGRRGRLGQRGRGWCDGIAPLQGDGWRRRNRYEARLVVSYAVTAVIGSKGVNSLRQ